MNTTDKKIYDSKYYLRNRERKLNACAEYYQRNKKRLNAQREKYRQEHEEKLKQFDLDHKSVYCQHKRDYNKEVRRRVEDLLGNKCAYCGITDTRVLQIDHLYSNGRQDKREYGHGSSYYKHILKVGGIGYQLLCANCNWIKRYETREQYWRY